jgi:hypothetical protein
LTNTTWKLRPLLEVFCNEGVTLPQDEYLQILSAILNMRGWKSMTVADQSYYRDQLWKIGRKRNTQRAEREQQLDDRIQQLNKEFAQGHASDVDGDMRLFERWGAGMDSLAWMTCAMLLFSSTGWRKLSPQRKAANFSRLEAVANEREERQKWRIRDAAENAVADLHQDLGQ